MKYSEDKVDAEENQSEVAIDAETGVIKHKQEHTKKSLYSVHTIKSLMWMGVNANVLDID